MTPKISFAYIFIAANQRWATVFGRVCLCVCVSVCLSVCLSVRGADSHETPCASLILEGERERKKERYFVYGFASAGWVADGLSYVPNIVP